MSEISNVQVAELAGQKQELRGALHGNDPIDRPEADSNSNVTFVDQEARIGVDGRVTAFRIFAKRTNPIELIIYRKTGDTFSIVGRSAAKTPAAVGVQEFALEAPIEVKAGDLIGWHDVQAGAIAFTYGGAANRVGFALSHAPTLMVGWGGRIYSIQVRVEATGGSWDKEREDLQKRIVALEDAAKKCGACDEKLIAQAKTIDDLSAKLDDLTKKLAELTSKPEQKPEAPPPPPAKADDLETIEGIGPKIADLLKSAGIRTYKDLAAIDLAELKKILKAGGTQFARNDPSSWPKQAQLILAGDKAGLKTLQDKLRAGRDIA